MDDKLRILAAMKKSWGARLTTVFPRQGHYALDPANVAAYAAADITVERIGDLVEQDFPALLDASESIRMHGQSIHASEEAEAQRP